MEENKTKCSFCEFLGKMVLKAAAVISVFAAINILLTKVFNKKISVQVAIDDIDGSEENEAECKEAEEDENTEEE